MSGSGVTDAWCNARMDGWCETSYTREWCQTTYKLFIRLLDVAIELMPSAATIPRLDVCRYNPKPRLDICRYNA